MTGQQKNEPTDPGRKVSRCEFIDGLAVRQSTSDQAELSRLNCKVWMGTLLNGKPVETQNAVKLQLLATVVSLDGFGYPFPKIVRFYTLNSGHGPSQATLSFILGSPLAQHASRRTAILQATSNSFSRFALSAPNRQIKGQ